MVHDNSFILGNLSSATEPKGSGSSPESCIAKRYFAMSYGGTDFGGCTDYIGCSIGAAENERHPSLGESDDRYGCKQFS